jgi:signal transduction histidine kinase
LNHYEEIAAKNEKLLELEKTKDGLIHMIVHDLRNPLFSIFGNLDLMLQAKEKPSQNQITYLETCMRSCEELKEMIDSLLDIYKMEEGKMQLNLEQSDVVALIKDIIQPFFIKATEKQIEILYDRSNRNLTVEVDKGLIKRVFTNLINNAIRHTPSGGTIRISADTYQNNGNIHVEVEDTGNGIAPAFHQKIFDKFKQVKLRKSDISVGASGLGLAFCKLAVEAHGGKIWVESEGEGQGTNFQFILPVKPSNQML